jgi:hypothetical protein
VLSINSGLLRALQCLHSAELDSGPSFLIHVIFAILRTLSICLLKQ